MNLPETNIKWPPASFYPLKMAIVAIGLSALAAAAIQPAAAQDISSDLLTRDSVIRDPDIPSLGNPKGNITIVEYFDYRCPYCKSVNPILMKIAKDDGNVRIVVKDWPIFGGPSIYAARMVLASKYQNKYAEAHEALISAKSSLTEGVARDLLSKAGVDVARATADLEANQTAIDQIIVRNNAQAEAFGFQGTPAFIIGIFRIPVVLDAVGFKQAISDARAAAAKGR